MKVVCCYTRLHPETEEIMWKVGADMRWCGDDAYHYWRVIRELWAEGKPLILVEHDLVPTPEQLQELADCPEPVCTVRYAYCQDHLAPQTTTGLGVIKLGRRGGSLPPVDFKYRWSVLPEGDQWHWNDVVTYLFGQIGDRHLHDLEVTHHHDCEVAHPRRVNVNSPENVLPDAR